jgi:hypothetical protein
MNMNFGDPEAAKSDSGFGLGSIAIGG